MNIISIIFIGFGLAMDCFAVAITSGSAIKNLKINHALRIGLFFGSFQAIMPLIGWLAGLGLQKFICGIDHWITFGLLSFIGCKMIYESFQMDDQKNNILNLGVLVMLSIATSIDALAVGVSFAFLDVFITPAVIIIGVITFLVSIAGIYIGNKIGHFFEKRMEIVGGIILIAIGIKILFEHIG